MTKVYRLIPGISVLFLMSLRANNMHGKRELSSSYFEISNSISSPELTVFAAPEGAPANNTFSVFVRYEGGKWIDLHEYDAEVDGGYDSRPLHHMAFVAFDADFSKKIEVEVHKNDGPMSGIRIRPDIAGIIPTIIDKHTISFTLTEPKKLSVEVAGDMHNNLMVFANKPEADPVKAGDENVYYFGPGIHKIGGNGQGSLVLKSNDKVYIAGGAIVYGSIEAFGVKNVSVTGRGILCGEMYTDHAYPRKKGKRLIWIDRSSDIKIDGITLLNTVTWNVHISNSSDIVCNNLKIMGWTINSDGINPTSSGNVLIDDCFIRNFDDCISVKLGYGRSASPAGKDSRHITVQNTVLWTDQGRAIALGPEFYSDEQKIMENMTFRNIDILYNKNYDVEWAKGVLSILLGDDVTLQNIVFEDIRVDKIGSNTNLICLTILQTDEYNLTPGNQIRNITFNRVSLHSKPNIASTISGYDHSRMISGIEFTDLKINNAHIKDAAAGNIRINEYTQDVKFKVSAGR